MADLFPKKSLLPRQYKVLIQQTEPVDGGLSAIELRVLHDLAEMTGKGLAHAVVPEHINTVSNEEAINLLSGKMDPK